MRIYGPVNLSIHSGKITQCHAIGRWAKRLQKSNLFCFASTVGLKVVQVIKADLSSARARRTTTKQADSDSAQSKYDDGFANASEHSLSPIQKLHEVVEPETQGN